MRNENHGKPVELPTRSSAYSFYAWFAVAFLLAELLGQSFAYGVDSISILWPPTGILGAALVITHRKHWIPIVLVATGIDMMMSGFIVLIDYQSDLVELNMQLVGSKLVGFIINPAAPLIFAITLERMIPNYKPLSSPKAFGLYVLVPIVLNTALVSCICMWLNSLLYEDFPIIEGWQQWWYSDITGFLAFATPIIVIAANRDQLDHLQSRSIEATLVLVCFTATSVILFTDTISFTSFQNYKFVLMLPVFAWVVARFGSVVMSLTTLILTIVVLSALVSQASPFDSVDRSAHENAIAVQGFLVPVMLVVLFIASIIESRKTQFSRILDQDRQMRNLSRVQSLGTMAGGVAHDFGNLTIAMRAYHSVLRQQIDNPSEEVISAIQGLEEAADGTQSLTRSLMSLAREESQESTNHNTTIVDLCSAVEEAIASIKPLISTRNPLGFTKPEREIPVLANKSDILRIISNLIVNARDASQSGQPIEVALKVDDQTVWLLVTDHGSGMSSETKEHAFDPFYTTKPRGRGTGLGLSVVAGTVRDMGATINLASTEGVGTTIVIKIPIANAATD